MIVGIAVAVGGVAVADDGLSMESIPIESELAQGALDFHEHRDAEAEKRFDAVLRRDPENLLAVEYLAVLSERRGNLKLALDWLKRGANIAGPIRHAYLEYHVGRLLVQEGRLEESLDALAIAETSAVMPERFYATYLRGYVLYKLERFREAEEHLHLAKGQLDELAAFMSRKHKKPIFDLPDARTTAQAIRYYLGEIYARLGFVRYASSLLHEAEYGENRDIRIGAWRIHSELNKPSWYAALGFYTIYDSNVSILRLENDFPIAVSRVDAGTGLFAFKGGWRSEPLRPWSYGIDATAQTNLLLNRDLRDYDLTQLAVSPWGAYWNGEGFSAELRADLEGQFRDRLQFSGSEYLQGVDLSVRYFADQRWNWEAGTYYRVSGFSSPLEVLGAANWGSYGKLSMVAPNPAFRPSLRYAFEMSWPGLSLLNYQSHEAALGFDFDVDSAAKFVFKGDLAGRVYFFTDEKFPGTDRFLKARLAFNWMLSRQWALAGETSWLGDYRDAAESSFERLRGSVGVLYFF